MHRSLFLRALVRRLARRWLPLRRRRRMRRAAQLRRRSSIFSTIPPSAAAVLSPDAQARWRSRHGRTGKRDALAVIDLANNKRQRWSPVYGDADIGDFQLGEQRAPGVRHHRQRGRPGRPALRARPVRGQPRRREFHAAGRRSRADSARRNTAARSILPWNTLPAGASRRAGFRLYLCDQPQSSHAARSSYVDLLRLNTLTGRARRCRGPAHVQHWLLDHKGEPRLAIAVEDKNVGACTTSTRPARQWRKISSYNTYTARPARSRRSAFGPDGTLYVDCQRRQGQDGAAHLRFRDRQRSIPSRWSRWPATISTAS